MRNGLHILLAILGALVGASLSSDSVWLLAAAFGALAGLGFAEAAHIARRLKSLESQVSRLQTIPAAARDRRQESAAVPDRSDEPAEHLESALRTWQASSSVSTGTASPEHLQPAAAPLPPQKRMSASSIPKTEIPVLAAVRQFLTGGNALVRIGVVVLFFGVAFLLRYMAEHTHVPIEFRLTGVALGALVLLVLGWRLRVKRFGYALALQGGAVGILYLTVFAALRLYSLLSPATAFPLLVLLAAFSGALAILQSSQPFALLAVTGGFLAPILASSAHGDHVVLFTYYAILNAAILGIAWFKAWRPLNLMGFLFTFVIATVWGALQYHPEAFRTTEPFLILFFLFYVAIAVLFTLRQAPELRGYVDGTLVFATPIVAFGLQVAMLHDRLLPLAYSALAVGGLYLALAWVLYLRRSLTQRLLVEAFLALGVAFISLAVPLALNGSWSSATWALEGVALIWVGCRQNRPLSRAFGSLLQFAAGYAIWLKMGISGDSLTLPAGMFLSALLAGVASIYGAYILDANRHQIRDYERSLLIGLFFWGLIWWCVSAISEIQRLVPHLFVLASVLSLAVVTALLSSELHQRGKLAIARIPAILLLPAMLLFAMGAVATMPHPLAYAGWVASPLAFFGLYILARRHEEPPGGDVTIMFHAVSVWLLASLLSWEIEWQVRSVVGPGGSWSSIAWAVTPAIMLFLLPRLTTRLAWPFARHRETYLLIAGSGFAAYLSLWSISANFLMRGDSDPLPYVPLFNPLDLAQAFILLVLIRHYVILQRASFAAVARSKVALLCGLALLAFISLNGALLRTLNHWAGVPFSLEAMLSSTLVETSLSIFWAALALATMLIATRLTNRGLWIIGAGLLALVVVKLFLVDLSNIGTIERIVSFVGVGLLMLVLGYFSPVPPVAEEHQ